MRYEATYRDLRVRVAKQLASWRHRPFTISRSPADDGVEYPLMMCAVFRNDADYLREWIEYHRLVGAEKFVLFNNNSVDDYRSVLAPYLDSGIVSLHHLPRIRPTYWFYWRVQLHAYNACLEQYRDRARWIAFLDLDEFLNPLPVDSMVEFLADYEEHPALAVHWVLFSTSGHVLRPDALVTAAYTACDAKGHVRVKVVVDPRRTVEFLSPHHARYVDGTVAVNELGEPVSGPSGEIPSVSRIRLNHYFTRSVEEYQARYLRNQGNRSGHKSLGELISSERDFAADTDTSIQRFLPRLQGAVAESR